MPESATINGKEYISTKEASKISSYTSDYVGQLAREGRVPSEKVGRRRFVDKKALLAYAAVNAESEKITSTPKISSMVSLSVPKPTYTGLSEKVGESQSTTAETTASMTGLDRASIRGAAPDESDEATLARWQTSFSALSDARENVAEQVDADTFSIPIRRTTGEANAMSVPIAPKRSVEIEAVEENEVTAQEESSTFASVVSEGQGIDDVDGGSSSYFALAAMTVPLPPYAVERAAAHSSRRTSRSSLETRSRSIHPLRQAAVVTVLLLVAVIGTTFYETRVGAGQSLTAAAGDSYLETFAVEVYRTIAGFFGGRSTTKPGEDALARTNDQSPISDTPTSVESDSSNVSGLVVFESPETEAERQARIDQVKRSFSDEVIVDEDDLGGSGTIQPVFRSGQGDEYVYVLVPINKGSQSASISTSTSLGTP
jgi:hypothetical protein